jgi:RES domain-containing protein
MKVYQISKCKYIHDLEGTGAANYAGRWHSKGTHILYTAATPSLALLESVVHISRLTLSRYCLLCLTIPNDKIRTLEAEDLPEDWQLNPAPIALRKIGDRFITAGQHLALRLPSAIMPEENNYLLNPHHPDFHLVSVFSEREIAIDERLIQPGTGT